MPVTRNYANPNNLRDVSPELKEYLSELVREIEAKDSTLIDEVNGGTP